MKVFLTLSGWHSNVLIIWESNLDERFIQKGVTSYKIGILPKIVAHGKKENQKYPQIKACRVVQFTFKTAFLNHFVSNTVCYWEENIRDKQTES